MAVMVPSVGSSISPSGLPSVVKRRSSECAFSS